MASPRENKILIIIPAHNEEAFIGRCLESFAAQTRTPDELRVVSDHCTDNTSGIVRGYQEQYPWICLLERKSSPAHQPGPKVVETFRAGLETGWDGFDFIGKFDADILLPAQYLEQILKAFREDPNLGMCSGELYTEHQGKWTYEPIANPGHVRGPVKLYSRKCFEAIGGLRPYLGWDTADTLLARYHGFRTATLAELHVKHLRPTGSGYSRKNAALQGRALYNLRYGWALSLVASFKMGWKRRAPALPFLAMAGYLKAWLTRQDRMLDQAEGAFARQWRWQQVRGRLVQGFRDGQSGSPAGEGRAQ